MKGQGKMMLMRSCSHNSRNSQDYDGYTVWWKGGVVREIWVKISVRFCRNAICFALFLTPFTSGFSQNAIAKDFYGRKDCSDLAPLLRTEQVIECAKLFLKYNNDYVNDYGSSHRYRIENEIDKNCCNISKGSFYEGAEWGIYMEYIDRNFKKRSISISINKSGYITNIYEETF
jgi:hypothetical protein